MSLGDELFALKTQRSAGRIDPVEYHHSLSRLLDASPDVAPDQIETILTCVRRIEALLEDRLRASGDDLDRKVVSRADRIPPDLQTDLRSIAALCKSIRQGDALGRGEIGALQSRCDHALRKVSTKRRAASRTCGNHTVQGSIARGLATSTSSRSTHPPTPNAYWTKVQ